MSELAMLYFSVNLFGEQIQSQVTFIVMVTTKTCSACSLVGFGLQDYLIWFLEKMMFCAAF